MDAGSTSIRQVGLESYDAALALLERFFREEGFNTPSREMGAALSTLLAEPGSALFLAEQGAKAVGVATVTTSVGIEYGCSAELEDLYIVPQARGGGVATALIEAVCTWCRQQGCTSIQIVVTPEAEVRHHLIAFYARRGFGNTGRLILERGLAARHCCENRLSTNGKRISE